MSTPASQALSSAATAGAGSPPPAGTVAAPAAGTALAVPNPTAFYAAWDKPEQKEERDWVATKGYKDPYEVTKAARINERDAAVLRAGKGYPVETTKADGTVAPPEPQSVAAWNALTGVPDAADKYDIPLPADNPYPQFKTFMAEEMFAAHVPGAMAKRLAQGYERAVAKMEAHIKAQEDQVSAAALAELQNTWGANFKERMAFAARGSAWLAKEAGGLNDLQLRVLENVLTTPKYLAMMWKIGAGNGEARFAGGDNPANFVGGASEAQAEYDRIQAQRSEGKISDYEWRGTYEKKCLELRDIIVAGMATQQ